MAQHPCPALGRYKQLSMRIEFSDTTLENAAIRIKLWGVTLPAWAAFSSLHSMDEPGEQHSGRLWYRAGTLGRYTLQRVRMLFEKKKHLR